MGKEENINIKLTTEQRGILKKLIGEMGGTETEVLRNIFISWISEKGIASEVIKKRLSKSK
jgi:hypothetical protein